MIVMRGLRTGDNNFLLAAGSFNSKILTAHRTPDAVGNVTPGMSILTSYAVSMAARS